MLLTCAKKQTDVLYEIVFIFGHCRDHEQVVILVSHAYWHVWAIYSCLIDCTTKGLVREFTEYVY